MNSPISDDAKARAFKQLDHAAAIDRLDYEIERFAKIFGDARLPLPVANALAALYRAGVPLLGALIADLGLLDDDDGAVGGGTDGDTALTFKHIRDLKAALAAVATALTNGEGK